MTWILDDDDNPIPEPDKTKWYEWRKANHDRVCIGYSVHGEVKIIFDFVGVGPRDKLFTVELQVPGNDSRINGYATKKEAEIFYRRAVRSAHIAEVAHSCGVN